MEISLWRIEGKEETGCWMIESMTIFIIVTWWETRRSDTALYTSSLGMHHSHTRQRKPEPQYTRIRNRGWGGGNTAGNQLSNTRIWEVVSRVARHDSPRSYVVRALCWDPQKKERGGGGKESAYKFVRCALTKALQQLNIFLNVCSRVTKIHEGI